MQGDNMFYPLSLAASSVAVLCLLSYITSPAHPSDPSTSSLTCPPDPTRSSAYPSWSIYSNLLKPDIEGLRSPHPWMLARAQQEPSSRELPVFSTKWILMQK